MQDFEYNVLDIIRGTTVDGPGFRTSIYLSGCAHRCPGCHNPQSWEADAGTPMTLQEILEVVRQEDFNVTLSGGDPLFRPEAAAALARAISELGYTVWLYTGFTYEEILASPALSAVLPYVEAVVDGPYVEALRDPDLLFRGSSNQRIIYPHSKP